MGFSEDDRIRNKNRHYNCYQNSALDIYEGLKAMGYDNTYILKYAEFALQNASDSCRIEVLNTIISILGSLCEKPNSN